jgi:hypothetical protein
MKTLYVFIATAVFLINIIYSVAAAADIYMRVGKNGTVYFSNVPVSSGYNLYMRTQRKAESILTDTDAYYIKI